MTQLHTFGCSITQGFALPDVVKPLTDAQGQPLTHAAAHARPFHWEDIHLLQPSSYAWPAVLAEKLAVPVINRARRGACTAQIARQCVLAAPTIKPSDTVIVMWTYLSRISLQWPARTAVPLTHVIDPHRWLTHIPGFNKFFGLSQSKISDHYQDQRIQEYIYNATRYAYLDPLGIYDRYYNNLVLQSTTAGLLDSTGARVIHLSVETEPYLDQLDQARSQLDSSLISYTRIPDPRTWYSLAVDHSLCRVIHDPSIPPAENDMHPSITHHRNFADQVYEKYFTDPHNY